MEGLSSHSHVHGYGKLRIYDENRNYYIATFPIERRKGHL